MNDAGRYPITVRTAVGWITDHRGCPNGSMHRFDESKEPYVVCVMCRRPLTAGEECVHIDDWGTFALKEGKGGVQ